MHFRNKNHQPQAPYPPPAPRRITPPEHEEQQLFMGRPAPWPPQFATARMTERTAGLGPPCTFRYALTPSLTGTLRGA